MGNGGLFDRFVDRLHVPVSVSIFQVNLGRLDGFLEHYRLENQKVKRNVIIRSNSSESLLKRHAVVSIEVCCTGKQIVATVHAWCPMSYYKITSHPPHRKHQLPYRSSQKPSPHALPHFPLVCN